MKIVGVFVLLLFAGLLTTASAFSSSTREYKDNDETLLNYSLSKSVHRIQYTLPSLDIKKEKFIIQCCFDSDKFDQLVDATQLLGSDEELDDDNALMAQDDSLASGSNSTIIHVEDSLDRFLTRDVTVFMLLVFTSCFLSYYQSLMCSDTKTQRKGNLGLNSVCAVFLLTILLLISGANAILASPVGNEVEFMSSCNGAGDIDNPTTGNHTVSTSSSCSCLYQHPSTTGTETDHNFSMCPSRPLSQPSSGVCNPIKGIAMDSLQEAFGLLEISPGSFPSCAARDYPVINSMKGILKQFCSVTMVVEELTMLDSSNSTSMPQQNWKAAPSSLPSVLLDWCSAFPMLLLFIVDLLTLFVFQHSARHIYNETGPVAEVPEFVKLPSPLDGVSDAFRAYRNSAVPGITPTTSCIQIGDSGDVYQPSPAGLPTQPEIRHRQSTTTSHTTELVGIGQCLSVIPASCPHATAIHGCVAPFGLQMFTAPSGDDSHSHYDKKLKLV